MDLSELPKVTLVSAPQSRKALFPIEVTPLPILTVVKEEQW